MLGAGPVAQLVVAKSQIVEGIDVFVVCSVGVLKKGGSLDIVAAFIGGGALVELGSSADRLGGCYGQTEGESKPGACFLAVDSGEPTQLALTAVLIGGFGARPLRSTFGRGI